MFCADAREVLPSFPDGHFHCVITSPPYWGLRDYGLGPDSLGLEPTPELYVQHLVEIFREVRRVLHDDGTLWLNLGDSYAGSQKGIGADGRAYGGPKQRTNTASIGLPVTKDIPGLKPKDLVGVPWMVAFALRADGWYLRSDIIWHKPNVMPESVRDRPTKAHEYVFLLSKSRQYYYDQDAIREPKAPATVSDPRTSKDGHRRDRDYIGAASMGGTNLGGPSGRRNRRTVWSINTQPLSGIHCAVFPEKLVEPCILAGCPDGSIVLDPFAGSGTVGVVAQKLNRNAVLIDVKPEYAELAMERCGLLEKASA